MIELNGIIKKYGPVTVLNGISLTIKPDECYCLIGKNGAGKSTLINILIDFIACDKGEIKILNTNYSEDDIYIRQNIGVLPEFNPLIEDFTGYDYLKYIGLIYGLPDNLIKNRIDILSEYFYDEKSDIINKIAHYSKGMKVKLGICAAVIHKPKILILDEPFENLDPSASKALALFLLDYRKQGNAILISSHEINYIEKIATHIGILKETKLSFSGSVDQIINEKQEGFDEVISDLLGYYQKPLVNL
ncbi:MAG: ABC transporter ATP-binding protein [Balneolales bacterium]